MPDETSNANANASPPAAGTAPPSGAAPTGAADAAPAPATGAQQTGFKFTAGPNVPSWAVGRTAEEVATIAGQLYSTLQQQMAAPAPVVEPSYVPAPPSAPQAQGYSAPSAEDWQSDPAGATQRYLSHVEATRYGPVLMNQQIALGQLARQNVAQEERDAFQRWGPEIDQALAGIDPSLRTVDNIRRVVNIVKGQHVSELVEDRLKAEMAKLAGQAGDTLARGGAAGTSATGATVLNSEGLPPGTAAMLREAGVDQAVLDEFLMKTVVPQRNITLQQARTEWMEKAKKGDVVLEHRMPRAVHAS